jgi:malonyl-CoA/methylmalonyl-CoA synthetase
MRASFMSLPGHLAAGNYPGSAGIVDTNCVLFALQWLLAATYMPLKSNVFLTVLLLLLQILGRSSVDIIKSGGFKISALDIEGALLHHPNVAEAAVLGLPDESLGEVVAALIVPKATAAAAGSSSSEPSSDDALLAQLKGLSRRELPSYCLPRVWRLLDAPLPRNAMGKVNKKQLLKEFFPEQVAAAAATGSAGSGGGAGQKQT